MFMYVEYWNVPTMFLMLCGFTWVTVCTLYWVGECVVGQYHALDVVGDALLCAGHWSSSATCSSNTDWAVPATQSVLGQVMGGSLTALRHLLAKWASATERQDQVKPHTLEYVHFYLVDRSKASCLVTIVV